MPCRLFCLSLLKAEKVAKRLILCLYYRGPYKGRIIVPWETESKAKDKRPWLRDPKILIEVAKGFMQWFADNRDYSISQDPRGEYGEFIDELKNKILP